MEEEGKWNRVRGEEWREQEWREKGKERREEEAGGVRGKTFLHICLPSLSAFCDLH